MEMQEGHRGQHRVVEGQKRRVKMKKKVANIPYLEVPNNPNHVLSNITEEEFQRQVNEVKPNITFNEFLHEVRSLYQEGNWTKEQAVLNDQDNYWTGKDGSKKGGGVPPQENRTNQD